MIIPDFWRIRCLRLLSFLWLRQLQQPKSLPLRQMSVSLALASNDNWVKNLIPKSKRVWRVQFKNSMPTQLHLIGYSLLDINMGGRHTEMKRKSNFTVGLHTHLSAVVMQLRWRLFCLDPIMVGWVMKLGWPNQRTIFSLSPMTNRSKINLAWAFDGEADTTGIWVNDEVAANNFGKAWVALRGPRKKAFQACNEKKRKKAQFFFS